MIDSQRTTVFKPIQQPSVVEQIIETFKQNLIHGQLKAGQRLPSENELSQQLGVGRSAVREAMKVLQALGGVVIRQGDGTFVADEPSPALLSQLVFAILLEAGMNRELFELRYMVQVGYCELAAQNATPEDFAAIEQAARSLELVVEKGEEDIEKLTNLDLNFHYSILDATHNPLVTKIGRTVEELYFVSIRDTLMRDKTKSTAIGGHRAIVAALHTGKPMEIRSAIDQSLVTWKEEVYREKK